MKKKNLGTKSEVQNFIRIKILLNHKIKYSITLKSTTLNPF